MRLLRVDSPVCTPLFLIEWCPIQEQNREMYETVRIRSNGSNTGTRTIGDITLKPTQKAEFLTEEEYNTLSEDKVQEDQNMVVPDWQQTMASLSKPNTRLAIPKNKDFSRKEVVQAFQNAFELIGGTARLALWAHENEGDFFKLYSRLLPSQANSALGESSDIVIRHILPRGELD